MRRVEISDGEGLVEGDINMVGQLADRNLGRWLSPNLWADSLDLRLVSGSEFALSGSENRTITLDPGLYLQPRAPADDDDPDFTVGEYAGGPFTVDARTSGAVFRRDIVQAKVDAESTDVSVSRDFEDAMTRAKSSTATDKRRIATATLSIKKGTDQASEVLADANEPAPDAGYAKVYSILIPSAGSCSAAKVWDWHSPLGSGNHFCASSNVAVQGDMVIASGGTAWNTFAAAVGKVVGHFPRMSTQVGIRIARVRGRFTTHGDNVFSVLLSDGNNNIRYSWDDDLVEGSALATYDQALPRPVWSTGLLNRLAVSADITPPHITWSIDESATGNTWDWFEFVFVGQ